MRKTTDTSENNTNTSNKLQWIKHVIVDGKSRISIPTEWRHILAVNSEIILLSTGKCLILAPRILYGENDSPDIIPIYWKIDNTGRLLLSKDPLESIWTCLWNDVYLIWKGNYAELYTDKTHRDEAVEKSNQAVTKFRSKLLGMLWD